MLNERELDIYHKGQIGLLKDIHDQIDAAGAEAYGWPVDLTDEKTLERLAKLFRGAGARTLTPILESLVALGQARIVDEGRYAA